MSEPSRNSARLRRAFTLLEIMLVMAVIVIIVALLYPSLEGMFGQQRVAAGTDSFRAALAYAKGRAIEEGVPYRVSLLPGKGNFRVAPDSDAHWSGGGSTSFSDDKISAFVFEGACPRGVIFSESSHPAYPERDEITDPEPEEIGLSSYRTFAVFLPDGTARLTQTAPEFLRVRGGDEARVLICARNGNPDWVLLRGVTGSAAVERYSEGGQ